MVRPENLQNRSSQTTGKRCFEFVFCNQQSHIVDLLKIVYRKCVKYSFLSRDPQKVQKTLFLDWSCTNSTAFHKKAILLIV